MRALTEMKQSKADKNISESGLVSSKQQGVHSRLEAVVCKHLQSPWLQPLHFPTTEAFRLLEQEAVFSGGQPFILDSGCGTGKSTQRIANMFPGHLVIGVDRSIDRLAKSGVSSGVFRCENYILLRAELATFWRLLLNSGFSPERHFLLYPNPWPKPRHLSRRWHGHPVFPQLLALGGEIELRSNWGIYAEEFAQAVGIATAANISVKNFQPVDAISPFEQKYLDRGQSLYSVLVPAKYSEFFRRSRLSD